MKANSLGSRIRSLRMKSGLTQIQLADRIYISESYIALIEADKRNPSMEIVGKIADFFCVTSDYLIRGEKTEADKQKMKDWSSVIQGRTQKEIEGALQVVKSFFECIDENKK